MYMHTHTNAQAMRKERGYDYEDTCNVSRETLPNYEDKIKSFYEEHIHSDEVRGWPACLVSRSRSLASSKQYRRPHHGRSNCVRWESGRGLL